ncbi:MAG: DUF2207 domain-containing protein [Longimicrobiales bacterium]
MNGTMCGARRLLALCWTAVSTTVYATAAIAGFASLGTASPVAAQRTLTIERFAADMHVRTNGDVQVSETITVRFTGSWNGIFRTIPVEYRTDQGANYTLQLGMQRITDDAGNELEVETSRDGRNRVFKIWVPGAQDATRTVVLQYVVRNGLRFFEEHDELYWNVTGDETEFEIVSAGANVYLPAEATGIRATAYTGVYGSVDRDVSIDTAGNLIRFDATRPLGFREGLTIVVGWNPGVVERPTSTDRIRDFLLSNFILGVPVLALVGMFALWRSRGRDPELRPITPRYEPPSGFVPAEAGTLIDASPDMRDVTATLVDLAVRGFIRIEETDEKQFFGLLSNQVFTFHLVRGREEWAGLREFERELLDALFKGSKRVVNTEDLENSFYKDLPGIRSKLSQSLVEGGHYLRHPNRVRIVFGVLAFVAGFGVAFAGSTILVGLLGQQPGPAVIAGVLTGLVVFVFGMIMPARTPEGTRRLEEILGFREFLERVEQDRFERIIKTPEMFESFLPFAMAFGVEKNWARAFDDIYRTPPDWYHGRSPHGFMAHAFTGNLGRMAAVTSTAMRVAPRSSSGSSGFSSGGGGGGFSGGGFGGGGVGGF